MTIGDYGCRFWDWWSLQWIDIATSAFHQNQHGVRVIVQQSGGGCAVPSFALAPSPRQQIDLFETILFSPGYETKVRRMGFDYVLFVTIIVLFAMISSHDAINAFLL